MSDRMSEKEKEAAYRDKCPECGTSWTKTPRPTVVGCYWHCLPCKKKAEDIPPKVPKVQSYNGFKSGSLLSEFEDMLEDWDDSSDDNWKVFTKLYSTRKEHG